MNLDTKLDSDKFNELIESLSIVRDPRVRGRCQHTLIDILILSILAILCGAEGIKDIVIFGKSKEEWLKTFLDLKNGIPSEDTIARVLAVLDDKVFESSFHNWVNTIVSNKKINTISLDGKSTKGTSQKFNGGPLPLHIVSAYSHEYGLTLMQLEAINSGITESKVGVECLKFLDLKDLTVLADAGFSTFPLVSYITENKGNYILPIKKNNKISLRELEDYLKKETPKSTKLKNQGHDRKEERVCELLTAENLSDQFKAKWPNVKCVFAMERKVNSKDNRCFVAKKDEVGVLKYERNKATRKTVVTKVFYVSSKLLTPKQAIENTRKHWEIENKLHWVLDVVFNEDACFVKS